MPACLLPADDGVLPYRGVMLDPCRHFLPVCEIKRLIEGMALLKLNVLHLHLSDDQGWRFESLKWPKLTSVASTRSQTVIGHPGNWGEGNEDLHPENYRNEYDGRPHGGFYTQAELRDLVAFARARNVTVIPEIDMPGHMRAARHAYPELGYDGALHPVGTSWGVYPEVLRVDEPGLQFAKDILGEICDVFDAPYVHIGGDECPKTEWAGSPKAQAQVRELGLNPDSLESYDKLQRWFTGQLAAFLKSRGRVLVGWDEITDGGVPDADADVVVMAWRSWLGAADRATRMGVPIVQTPALAYFDYAQGPLEDEPLTLGRGADLEEVYAFNPLDGVEPANTHLVLGTQAQLWSEYIPTPEHLWYMAFPRLIALADVAYYGDKRPSYEEFLEVLPKRVAELLELGLGSHPLPRPK